MPGEQKKASHQSTGHVDVDHSERAKVGGGKGL